MFPLKILDYCCSCHDETFRQTLSPDLPVRQNRSWWYSSNCGHWRSKGSNVSSSPPQIW